MLHLPAKFKSASIKLRTTKFERAAEFGASEFKSATKLRTSSVMSSRAALVDRLPANGLWVELGVASGTFAQEVCSRRADIQYLGIDRWSDHHDEAEMRRAYNRLSRYPFARLCRNSFEEAAKTLPEDSCDAVYVDGYAHTGQEAGRTLDLWWPKVKRGGFMCGHDYDLGKWPNTFKAVNYFAGHRGLPVEVIPEPSGYASWRIQRPHEDPKLLRGDCILVGNGPSLLDSELGDTIDSYSEVVRFNDFQTEGFEKHVGSRTTLWSCYGKNAQKVRSSPPERVAYLHGAVASPEWYEPKELWRIPVAFYDQVRNEVRSRSTKDPATLLPSAGLVTLRWLLDYHRAPCATLVGFDHFSRSKSKKHHYWREGVFSEPAEHDGAAEHLLFSEMADLGRVRCL